MGEARLDLARAIAETPAEERSQVLDLGSIDSLIEGAAALLAADAEFNLPTERGRACRRYRAALLLFLEMLEEMG